jgi:hypothetical protein
MQQAAILLGVLLAATDPIPVIATFKEAGVTGRLQLLVEAEGLLNDMTAPDTPGRGSASSGIIRSRFAVKDSLP